MLQLLRLRVHTSAEGGGLIYIIIAITIMADGNTPREKDRVSLKKKLSFSVLNHYWDISPFLVRTQF